MNLPRFPDPAALQPVADARALIRRARAEARRWTFRAILLAAVAGLSFRAGWISFGVIFVLLTFMAFALSRSTRKRAAQLAEKLRLMETQ